MTHVNAQTKSNKLEIGFNVCQYHKDFGLGIHLVSPYFANSKIAFRLGANAQWFEQANGTETTWMPYQNIQLGVKSRNMILEDKIYIYGEGGMLAILANKNISSTRTLFGGYGLFGFEFKPFNRFGYFIELGGVGTNATADKMLSKPIYSNGFLVNVGFRVGI